MGTLTGSLGSSPLETGTSLPASDCRTANHGIRSLVGFGKRVSPLAHPVLYLHGLSSDASPKAISRTTSYQGARLAFHPYPQLIPVVFNLQRFGPPRSVTFALAWPWIDRPLSGLTRTTKRPIQTRFRFGSRWNPLTSLHRLSRWPIIQEVRRHTCGKPHSAPTACRHTISGSISLALSAIFSSFPHGTCSLSVARDV